MRHALFFTLLFLLAAVPLRAGDAIRAAQEALRNRKLYYGDVDGKNGPDTQEALRRFQEKKGFDPTGQLDDTTLRALGLLPHASQRAPAIDRVEQSRDFVERYLQAGGGADLDAELAFFADRVDYFDDGASSRGDIRGQLADYRQNWPERKFELLKCIGSPSRDRPDEMIVTFRYRFVVRGGGHEREGFEDLRIVIRSTGPNLQIVSIHEA